MSKEQWINQNYSELLNIARKITKGHQLSMDLLHYVLEALLSKKDLESIIDSGGCQFYTIKMMTNSWKSTTSPFYTRYRKDFGEGGAYVIAEGDENCWGDGNFYARTNDLSYLPDEGEELSEIELSIVESIKDELLKLHWYDQGIFNLYLQFGENMSEVSRQTGIPRKNIANTVTRIKEHIKTVLNYGRINNLEA